MLKHGVVLNRGKPPQAMQNNQQSLAISQLTYKSQGNTSRRPCKHAPHTAIQAFINHSCAGSVRLKFFSLLICIKLRSCANQERPAGLAAAAHSQKTFKQTVVYLNEDRFSNRMAHCSPQIGLGR